MPAESQLDTNECRSVIMVESSFLHDRLTMSKRLRNADLGPRVPIELSRRIQKQKIKDLGPRVSEQENAAFAFRIITAGGSELFRSTLY
jgi:hypothetical protein